MKVKVQRKKLKNYYSKLNFEEKQKKEKDYIILNSILSDLENKVYQYLYIREENETKIIKLEKEKADARKKLLEKSFFNKKKDMMDT